MMLVNIQASLWYEVHTMNLIEKRIAEQNEQNELFAK